MTLKKNNRLPGPYPLPWISDKFCPDVQDIGIGLGCVKIIGNTQFSFPLCPGVVVLPAVKDPVRSKWQAHGLSRVEPALTPCDSLELINRKWSPAALQSEYSLGDAALRQTITVFDYGASVELCSEQLRQLTLEGVSFGPCKLWKNAAGLHVVETSPRLRPVAYSVRFDPMPEIVLLEAQSTRPVSTQPETFCGTARWQFRWASFPGTVSMEVNICRDGRLPIAKPIDVDKRLEDARHRWEWYYRESVPALHTPDERINNFCDYMAYVFRANGLRRNGLLSHPYSMPKQTFCGWWMWDSCFHAISASFSGERELAWGCLLNIENVQHPPGSLSAGTVSNQAFPYGVDVFESDDPMSHRPVCMPHLFPENHGDGTHPPIFAQALKALWTTDENDFMMRRLLPNALAYHDWFERRRRSDTLPGLLLIRRWSDSGMDNSPRWGKEGSGIYDTAIDDADWGIPMVTVDLNVYSVLEKQSLAEMLRATGDDERALKLENEAAERTVLIHQLLWDESKGLYMDRNECGSAFIPVMSPTGFYPLLLDDLKEGRVDAMLELLFDEKKFWSQMPIPSVAMDDPNFRANQSYWSGGTWMNYTTYVLRGLFRYRPEAAWKLLDRVIDGLMPKGIPNIFENYNPETGQGYDAANFGWAGLLVDVILRNMLAIESTRDGLTFGKPRCPTKWQGFEITHLFCHGTVHHIAAKQIEGRWDTEIASNDGSDKRRQDLAFSPRKSSVVSNQ